MSASPEWYYLVDNKKHGPVSTADLKKLAQSKDLKPDDLLWKEGLPEWTKAREAKGLFSETPVPAIPPPAFPKEPDSPPLSFEWNKWKIGGKMIFVSACMATLSLFADWAKMPFNSQTGMEQEAFLFLGFFIYPVWKLMQNGIIRRKIGIPCGLGVIALMLLWFYGANGSWEEQTGSTTGLSFGGGAYLFLLAGGLLVVGVNKYERY